MRTVAQFEKLWGDMTTLTEFANVFATVPRAQAQLAVWQRDDSAVYIELLGN